MARTIKEIYNQMVVEKENYIELKKLQPNISNFQSLLDDLTSTTPVAIWRMLFYIFAVAIHLFEVVLDLWWEDIMEQKRTLATGTKEWYADKILNFQYGYNIVWNGNQFEYEVEIPDAKIVKYVSITDANSRLTVKVAKDSSGEPEKLNSNEITSLQAYLDNIAFLGIKMTVLSLDPDLLDLGINVYVDGLILNSDGEDINGNTPIEDAIKRYLSELDFDGTLKLISLIDAVQGVQGVTNVVVSLCQLVTILGSFDILQEIGQQRQSYAGYIKLESLNINYIIKDADIGQADINTGGGLPQ